MLRFLFQRLTGGPKRGQAMFDAAVSEARQPHWYVEGGVPDSVEGRFAMLATVCALIMIRADKGRHGAEQSAALTERFVEAMDAEHRQMGINDPALGKRVRKLVGSLARRVQDWRAAVEQTDWTVVVRSSVYPMNEPGPSELEHCEAGLRDLWRRLGQCPDKSVAEGKF